MNRGKTTPDGSPTIYLTAIFYLKRLLAFALGNEVLINKEGIYIYINIVDFHTSFFRNPENKHVCILFPRMIITIGCYRV